MAPLLALRNQPPIIGLTELLVNLTEAEWNLALSRLAECGLISVQTSQSRVGNPRSVIDTHPLIREYFAQQVPKNGPRDSTSANSRVYKYFSAKANANLGSMEGLEAFMNAHEFAPFTKRDTDALADRYLNRINRLHSKRKFFNAPVPVILQKVEHIDDNRLRGFILHLVARRLRNWEQFGEAIEPLRQSLEIAKQQDDAHNAALRARHLSETCLLCGKVTDAAKVAEQAVVFADRCEDERERIIERVVLGNALNQFGKSSKAAEVFNEAEDLLRQFEQGQSFLYSLWGYMHLDLLLDINPGEVIKRTKAILTAHKPGVLLQLGLLDRPIIQLALCKARLRQFERQNAPILAKAILKKLDGALKGLRKAGYQDDIVRGLLAHAHACAMLREFDKVRRDLDEAECISHPSQMLLHLADVHLHRAHLCFREIPYPWKSPQADLAAARQLIETCGYWRRKQELEDAEEAAKNWP